jgi:hypothetical protein
MRAASPRRLRAKLPLWCSVAVTLACLSPVRTACAQSSGFEVRDASGTAWVPDDTPMHGAVRSLGDWQIMLHGNAVIQVVGEPNDRHRTGGDGHYQASSANWLMAMARRPVGRGRFGLRAALSAEPWTVGSCGFLNLLATGEMCDGDTIHDRQHPHDLFMELAADYDRPLRGALRWQVYGGLAGEPALGPPGFPHRPSAMPNPVAPITHHWLDSSHITFGLVTTGVHGRRWKAEVSAFNAREPDESRHDLDLGALDSVSGRLSWMPTPRLVLQVSAGHLNEAVADFPPRRGHDVTRTTASATYHRRTGGTFSATTVAYGVNAGPEIIAGSAVDITSHALLVESAITAGERHTWLGRAEVVGMPAHDLHAHEFGAQVFTVGKLEAGYVRHLRHWGPIAPGVGGMVSANVVPADLAPRYSGRVVPGFSVFLTLAPRHTM